MSNTNLLFLICYFQLDSSFPLTLQFGLVGLKSYVPEGMHELKNIIGHAEENVQIQLNIRKWFMENEELK